MGGYCGKRMKTIRNNPRTSILIENGGPDAIQGCYAETDTDNVVSVSVLRRRVAAGVNYVQIDRNSSKQVDQTEFGLKLSTSRNAAMKPNRLAEIRRDNTVFVSVLRRRLAGPVNSIQIHWDCSKYVHEANSDQNFQPHQMPPRYQVATLKLTYVENAMLVSVLRRTVSAGVNSIQIDRDCSKQVHEANSDQNWGYHEMPLWYADLDRDNLPLSQGLRGRLAANPNSIQID